MSFESILSHMNDHHIKELEGLVKKFAAVDDPKNVKLDSVDLEGLNISYEGSSGSDKVRVEFPQKATPESMKNAIIDLCMSVDKTHDLAAVEQEVKDFAKGFGSVCLATLNPKGEVLATYAAVIHHKEKFYIYISEVAEHYASIKANPNNIEVMFLEDESKAKSVILRKRLRYRATARFIQRESSEFGEVYDTFIAQTGGSGGIKTIQQMSDFHLIELITGEGRFVKGFGQAYSLHNGKATYLGGGGNPHTKSK